MLKKVLITITCLVLSLSIFILITKEVMAFDFWLSLNPQNGSTEKGGFLKSAVNIYWSSSDKGRVTLFPAVGPEGIKIKFSPSSCRPPCSSVMTVSVSKEAENRNYSIPIIATGQGITRTVTYYLSITPLPTFIEVPRLISPLNNLTVSSLTPFLDWAEVNGAKFYQWAVGNKNGITSESFLVVPTGTLQYNTKYDWKVKACVDSSEQNCSNWSEVQSFFTPKDKETLISSIQAQIAVIRAAILRLQEELIRLISAGGI